MQWLYDWLARVVQPKLLLNAQSMRHSALLQAAAPSSSSGSPNKASHSPTKVTAAAAASQDSTPGSNTILARDDSDYDNDEHAVRSEAATLVPIADGIPRLVQLPPAQVTAATLPSHAGTCGRASSPAPMNTHQPQLTRPQQPCWKRWCPLLPLVLLDGATWPSFASLSQRSSLLAPTWASACASVFASLGLSPRSGPAARSVAPRQSAALHGAPRMRMVPSKERADPSLRHPSHAPVASRYVCEFTTT